MIENKILEIFREVLKAEAKNCEVSVDMNLMQLGLNSLTYIKVIIAIEKELKIMFDDDELDIEGFKTVGDFIERVKQMCEQKGSELCKK